ncbi:MAG: hypothetical protein LAO05_09685 [Acidobacteriia bacterium]|nr:hypothetical protein [Terriglobia bacterium]
MTRFDAARRAAVMQDLLGVLTGRPVDLLPFDRVRSGLRLKHTVDRGHRDVPLELIVGTLGREREFNREFLPREEALRDRWEEVEELAEGPAGFPAVELYQVGDTYFVVDGHHRVSVARSLGVSTIEAHVKEFLTPVPIGPGASIEEVVLSSGFADFLEATGLVPAAPDEFRVSEPNGYERLLEHITVHRYYRGIESGRGSSWGEAVASWYDTVYTPIIAAIRRCGVMEGFPGRTETDLYLFTMDHVHHLRERYAPKPVPFPVAVRHFKFFYTEGRRLSGRLRSWWRRWRL